MEKPLVIKNYFFPISKSSKFLLYNTIKNIAKNWISKLPPNIKFQPLMLKTISSDLKINEIFFI